LAGPAGGPIDVRLRDVVQDDLPTFYQHQLDPEGARMAAFPPRDREAFMAHWRTRVLGDESVDKKTILVDGQVAGNVVSFERDGVREVGLLDREGVLGEGGRVEGAGGLPRPREGSPPVRPRRQAQRGLTPGVGEMRLHDGGRRPRARPDRR
jgi:hypothetical protein